MVRGGILIIGSLMWDNDQRAAWRRSHLSVDDKVYVKSPIRYGRLSRTRGNIFTMILGLDAAPGQAVIVPLC